MADNTVISAGAGGDSIRDKDRAGVKTQIVGLDLGIGGASESLMTAAALAEATANPTAPMLGAPAMVFNGTTWDRLHGNWRTTTGDTGAKTATFAGATQTNFDAVGAVITIQLGTVSGVSPTLACQLQYSFDGGTTWLSLGAALANLTATGQTGTIAVMPVAMAAALYGGTVSVLTTGFLPRTWRLNHTIGGTTPSFAITAEHVNYIGGA